MKRVLSATAEIADFLIHVAFIIILLMMFVGLGIWMLVQGFLLFDSTVAWVLIAMASCVVFAYAANWLKESIFPLIRQVRTGERFTPVLIPVRKIFALIGLFGFVKFLYLTLIKQEGNWWQIAW